MTAYPIPNPFSQWNDVTGLPLTSGYIWIGEPSQNPETHPIAVYQDAALSVPFPGGQPLRTVGGFLVGTGTPANAYPSATPYSISVRNKQNVEVYYQAVVHDELAEFLATLNSPSTVGLLGYNVETTYPASSVGKRLQSFVSVTDAPFNAKCDGSTDDTAAVQAALTYCIANRINALKIPGVCRIASKINYDNPVDNSTGGVVIYGGTITTAVTGPLIDTTLSYTTAPSSEMLFLQDMTFIHTSPAASGWLLSSGLLRLWMRGCSGIGFKINNGTAGQYLQDWDIDSSNRFVGWQGQLIDTPIAYNLRFAAKMEAATGGAGVKVGTVHGGLLGGEGALAEGILGPVAELGAFEGLTIDRWYTEGNTNLDFKVATTQISRGLLITGCRLAPATANATNSSFYNIDLGLSEDVVSISNWCGSRLYKDDSVAPGMLQSIGDKPVDPMTGGYMPTWLTKSGRFGFILPNGMDSQTSGITAHAGGGSGSATQLTTPVNVITVCATTGDSVKLPPAIPGSWCLIYNGGAAASSAFPNGTDTLVQNGGLTASSSVSANRLATLHCFISGQWIRTDIASTTTLTDPAGGGTVDTQARASIAAVNALLRSFAMAS